MSGNSDLTVGQRIRVYRGGNREHVGVIVDDFGDAAGYAVTVGQHIIAGPSRRWAITLDNGGLIFADSDDLRPL